MVCFSAEVVRSTPPVPSALESHLQEVWERVRVHPRPYPDPPPALPSPLLTEAEEGDGQQLLLAQQTDELKHLTALPGTLIGAVATPSCMEQG